MPFLKCEWCSRRNGSDFQDDGFHPNAGNLPFAVLWACLARVWGRPAPDEFVVVRILGG